MEEDRDCSDQQNMAEERLKTHVQGVLQGRQQGGVDASQVPLRAVTPPSFDISTQRTEFQEYLHEHGYAVVRGVATPQQIEHAKGLQWDYLESLPGARVRRDDVGTWGNENWFPSPSNGIIHGFGFGHSPFMWFLRLLPKVKAAFAAIWETEARARLLSQ